MKLLVILLTLMTISLSKEVHYHYHFNQHKRAIVNGHHAGWWCRMKCLRHLTTPEKKKECEHQCKIADMPTPKTRETLNKEKDSCEKNCYWKRFWAISKCKDECKAKFDKESKELN